MTFTTRRANRVSVVFGTALFCLPSAAMAQFQSPAIDEIARSLDRKVERLLEETGKRAHA